MNFKLLSSILVVFRSWILNFQFWIFRENHFRFQNASLLLWIFAPKIYILDLEFRAKNHNFTNLWKNYNFFLLILKTKNLSKSTLQRSKMYLITLQPPKTPHFILIRSFHSPSHSQQSTLLPKMWSCALSHLPVKRSPSPRTPCRSPVKRCPRALFPCPFPLPPP